MNVRRLIVLGGFVVLAIAVLRRRRRRDDVAIEIDEPDAPGPRTGEPVTSQPDTEEPDTSESGPGEPDTREQETDERPSDDDEATGELESVEGIGPAYAERLREAGVADVADLLSVDSEALARESGIARGRIRNWVERASAGDEA